MLVKSHKRDKPCIMYNNEPLECVESFKYISLEVPSNHRWNECAIRRFEGGNEHIMHLRTHAIMEKLSVGSSRNTLVAPVLLYGASVWGGSIPKSIWKEFVNVQ